MEGVPGSLLEYMSLCSSMSLTILSVSEVEMSPGVGDGLSLEKSILIGKTEGKISHKSHKTEGIQSCDIKLLSFFSDLFIRIIVGGTSIALLAGLKIKTKDSRF